jgi:hypothetical protein
MTQDIYSRLAQPIQVQGGSTSYFSSPEEYLDPQLFSGTSLRPNIRNSILKILFNFLNETYRHPDLWAHTWIAGSAVSYQWSAQREPADLDVLIGVDYVQFRKANPEFAGLADSQIASMLNDDFRTNLHPETDDWNGFEITFYVNATATDIRAINPYAAYDLTHDEWTVFPSKEGAPQNPVWEEAARRDHSKAIEVVTRYSQALNDVKASTGEAQRRNAETRLQQSLSQGAALFEDIHQGRKLAFSPTGQGYYDFHNYRWQSGKKLGTVHALRQMHDYQKETEKTQAVETYGVELPDTRTMVRRASVYRNSL